MIVQGVYELFEKECSTKWEDKERLSRLVFIGKCSFHSGAWGHYFSQLLYSWCTLPLSLDVDDSLFGAMLQMISKGEMMS